MTKWGMSGQVGVLRSMLTVFERHGISVDYTPNGIDNVSINALTRTILTNKLVMSGGVFNHISKMFLE